MTLSKPNLILTFTGDDLPSGHSAQQTVADSQIVRHSIRITEQLLDNLKSSSNQVTLQISRDCPSIEDIIGTDFDVRAVLKDGSDVIFTGFISTSFSWSVTNSGEQALNITLEDVGTRLFSRPFIETGHTLMDCTASSAVSAICSTVGVTVSSQCMTVTDRVFKIVDGGQSCRDILTKMLYELGYVYRFDNLGELRLFQINFPSFSKDSLPTLDGSNLKVTGNKAIGLSKSIRQYRHARVTYTELGTVQDFLVYRNTTGNDASHQYCNFSLGPGEHFDGTEIYSATDWSVALLDQFREPAMVEACNAGSETAIVGSNEILSVSDIHTTVVKGNDITYSIVPAGGPYLRIDAHNRGTSAQSITRMDAYGTVVFSKSSNVVRTDSTGAPAGSILEEELEYVHTLALARHHANLISQYHRYCNSRYAFQSETDIAAGTLVRLHDDVFSGLDVAVLVFRRSFSDRSGVFSYEAVGISAFDLDRDTYHRTTDRARPQTKGEKGDKGDTGSTGATGPQGPQGPQGNKGDTGDTGPQGEKGEKGDTGSTGPQGPQGEKGDTGPQGPQGNKGDKGDTGSTGPQGPQGNKGDKGDTGATGNGISTITYTYATSQTPTGIKSSYSSSMFTLSATNKYGWQKEVISYTDGTSKTTEAIIAVYGDKGDKGDKGNTGDTGPQGPQGNKGDTGATGPQGPQGNKGDKGDKGDTGSTGPQGPKGDKGDTGPQGPQGDKGDTGSTGPQGPQGPQGNPGAAGTPAYVWRFNSSSETFYRDKRSSRSQSISFHADVQGYSATPTWTATAGTLSASTGSSVTLSVPYDNSVNEITVTMSYASQGLTYGLTISVIDITEYGHDYGLLASAPSSPVPVFVTDKPTDSYTNSANGITYEYRASGWVASDDASKLVNGLKKLVEASPSIDLAAISNANTVSFFTKIIAQKIYADTIKAVQGFFDSITVTGNSFFYGTIKSSAFSTTLQNSTPSSTVTLSKGSTAYWNWDTFKAVLKANYSSGAYSSVSGTYSTIRVGTSRIALPYGQQDGMTLITNNTRSRSTNAFPRTQRVSITAETSGSTGGSGLQVIEIKVGGSVVGTIGSGGGTLIVNVTKGNAITVTGYGGTYNWTAAITYFDVPSDFPDVCFFDSSGSVHTYSGYNSGTLTVGSHSPSPTVYKWAGMSSASGGGETTSSSKLSVVNEDASMNISNKQIIYVSWTSSSLLKVTFSDYSEITLDSSKYYRTLSGSFSLLTASDSVVSATITPKTGTNTIGTSGNRFNEGHFNSLYGTLTGNVTGNLTGNVNSQGTSNKVWGAVFN